MNTPWMLLSLATLLVVSSSLWSQSQPAAPVVERVELVARTCEALKEGGGMPAIFNDEAIIPALERIGIPTPDASGSPPQVAEVDGGSVRCQRWLGGLLSHYYRRAA